MDSYLPQHLHPIIINWIKELLVKNPFGFSLQVTQETCMNKDKIYFKILKDDEKIEENKLITQNTYFIVYDRQTKWRNLNFLKEEDFPGYSICFRVHYKSNHDQDSENNPPMHIICFKKRGAEGA